MERRLKLRGWSGYKASSRARASSLVLLVLVAHALFVCVTHHHDRTRVPSEFTTATLTAEDGDSSNTPDSSSDSHCLSCRLQRNFVSADRSHSVMIGLPYRVVIHEKLLSHPWLNRPGLILSSRAPPLV